MNNVYSNMNMNLDVKSGLNFVFVYKQYMMMTSQYTVCVCKNDKLFNVKSI